MDHVKNIAKLITEDPDIFSEAEAPKIKSFGGEDISTTTVPKMQLTHWAEQGSAGLGGKGLCVYLVGNPESGLERHIHEKERLGFTDHSKHVIVEWDPKTAQMLAEYCRNLGYPDITVIRGDMLSVVRAIGFLNIEHLDFDGTYHYNNDTSALVKDALGKTKNIHIVGATRGASPPNQLPDGTSFTGGGARGSRDLTGWEAYITADLLQDAEVNGYDFNYSHYSSGGDVMDQPEKDSYGRYVHIWTQGRPDISGIVNLDDYRKLTAWVGHVRMNHPLPAGIERHEEVTDPETGETKEVVTDTIEVMHTKEGAPYGKGIDPKKLITIPLKDVYGAEELNPVSFREKEGSRGTPTDDSSYMPGAQPMFMAILNNPSIASHEPSPDWRKPFVRWNPGSQSQDNRNVDNLFVLRHEAEQEHQKLRSAREVRINDFASRLRKGKRYGSLSLVSVPPDVNADSIIALKPGMTDPFAPPPKPVRMKVRDLFSRLHSSSSPYPDLQESKLRPLGLESLY